MPALIWKTISASFQNSIIFRGAHVAGRTFSATPSICWFGLAWCVCRSSKTGSGEREDWEWNQKEKRHRHRDWVKVRFVSLLFCYHDHCYNLCYGLFSLQYFQVHLKSFQSKVNMIVIVVANTIKCFCCFARQHSVTLTHTHTEIAETKITHSSDHPHHIQTDDLLSSCTREQRWTHA